MTAMLRDRLARLLDDVVDTYGCNEVDIDERPPCGDCFRCRARALLAEWRAERERPEDDPLGSCCRCDERIPDDVQAFVLCDRCWGSTVERRDDHYREMFHDLLSRIATHFPGEWQDPEEMDAVLAEWVATAEARAGRIRNLERGLRQLLDYALQLETLVYPNATGGDETDIVETTRALLAPPPPAAPQEPEP